MLPAPRRLPEVYPLVDQRSDFVLHAPRQVGKTTALRAVWREGETDPLEEGLLQLKGYLAGLELNSGWLVIFDRRSGQPLMATCTRAEQALTPTGRRVTVLRA